MIRNTVSRVDGSSRIRVRKYPALALLTTACLISAGCSYIETLLARKAQYPDDRIVVGASEGFMFIARRDLPDYICVPDLVLVCENFGGTKYSCHCAFR